MSSQTNKQRLESLLAQNVQLPAMPAAVARVMQKLNDSDASIPDVAQAITGDPGLTSRILRIANSAFYGLTRSVDTVTQAIVVAGLRTLRNIVLGEASRSLYGTNSPLVKRMWEHSVAVGMGAYVVAKSKRLRIEEQAFVAGLMHDAGKAVMLSALGKPYEDVEKKVCAEGGSMHEAETAAFSFDHADVGAALVAKWELPETLEHVIRFHHNVEGAIEEAPENAELVCLINFADSLCHALGLGTGRLPATIDWTQHAAARELGITAPEIEDLSARVATTFEKEKGLFS